MLDFDLGEIKVLIEQRQKYDQALQAEFKKVLQRERILVGKTPEAFHRLSKKQQMRWSPDVDFSNLCPILQQLMSNWLVARWFRPISATQSTARADTPAATLRAVARATDDPLARRRRVKRFVDPASISRTDGRSQQYGMSPGESEQSTARLPGLLDWKHLEGFALFDSRRTPTLTFDEPFLSDRILPAPPSALNPQRQTMTELAQNE